MDDQKIIIVGNATTDAEIHQSEGKVAYADFTVGISTDTDVAEMAQEFLTTIQ